MNVKLLVGFGVVLVVLLVLPVVVNVARMSGAMSSGSASPAASSQSSGPAPRSVPPQLNAGNLVGSVWQVEPKPGIFINVTMNGGGQAVAHTDNVMVKMMAGTDTLSGTWAVSGDGYSVNVSTNVKNDTFKTSLDIIGSEIYHEGKKIQRLQ